LSTACGTLQSDSCVRVIEADKQIAATPISPIMERAMLLGLSETDSPWRRVTRRGALGKHVQPVQSMGDSKCVTWFLAWWRLASQEKAEGLE